MSEKATSPIPAIIKNVMQIFRDNHEFIEKNPHLIKHIDNPEQWHNAIYVAHILEQ